MKTLNDYAAQCHKANAKWWQNIDTGEPLNRNPKELLMLMVSELSECMEGERKNLMDDKLPHRKTAEVEIADFLIRVFDFAGGFNLNLNLVSPFYANEFEDLNNLSHKIHKAINRSWQNKINKAEFLFGIVEKLTEFKHGSIYGNATPLRQSIYMALDYAAHFGYDIQSAFDEKLAFNATREDHTPKARKIAGGKQF